MSLFGLNIQGDFGGLTCYKSARHRFTWFLATSPKVPASPAQQNIRLRWTAIARIWRNAPPTTRCEWNFAARAANLKISGYNLFVHAHATQDQDALNTINHQTGSILQLQPEVA